MDIGFTCAKIKKTNGLGKYFGCFLPIKFPIFPVDGPDFACFRMKGLGTDYSSAANRRLDFTYFRMKESPFAVKSPCLYRSLVVFRRPP